MRDRWSEVLALLAAALPRPSATLLVTGTDDSAVADTHARLSAALGISGGAPVVRPPSAAAVGSHVREAELDYGSGGGPRIVVWLRTSRRHHADEASRGDRADIVIDLHHRDWPVIRHVAPSLLDEGAWHLRESQAFFGIRAATWDAKFGDDQPSYAAAIRRVALPRGAKVLDAGCGTGRALAPLRAAVGPTGLVIGLDATTEMIAVARARPDLAPLATDSTAASASASAGSTRAQATTAPTADATDPAASTPAHATTTPKAGGEPANADTATTDAATAEPANADTATAEPANADTATTDAATAEPAKAAAATAAAATADAATAEPANADAATIDAATADTANADTATSEGTHVGTLEPARAEPNAAPPTAGAVRLVIGDARRLPFGDGVLDAVFAAGLVMHLPDVADGLAELARVTVAGGRLVLFHPTGRAALAERHGRVLRSDDQMAEAPLAQACARAGWRLVQYDDGDQFFALAERRP